MGEPIEKARDITEELDLVKQRLDQAKAHGLENEVVCYALRAMQQNVAITPAMAMDAGLSEWDC